MILTLHLKVYQKYLKENQPKVKCPCKNHSLHEYKAAKNNHELICNFSIYLLSINLDAPQYNNKIRCLNNKINYIYERALYIMYQDNTSTFQELQNKNTVSKNHRILQVLTTEIFKFHSLQKF